MEGVELEIQLNSEKLLNNFIDIFNPKYFLIFDYGYEYKDRDKKPYESLIRTYKEHHLSSEPLELPGETDITYDVNFTFVEKYFESKGYKKWGTNPHYALIDGKNLRGFYFFKKIK